MVSFLSTILNDFLHAQITKTKMLSYFHRGIRSGLTNFQDNIANFVELGEAIGSVQMLVKHSLERDVRSNECNKNLSFVSVCVSSCATKLKRKR